MGRQWLTLHNTLCSRWKDNLLPKKINKFQVQTNTKRQLDGNFHEKPEPENIEKIGIKLV